VEKVKAVTRRRDSIVGVNQYANPKEKPLEAPRGHDGIHKRRAQQIASHRTSLDDAENQMVLDRLAEIIGRRAKGAANFEACVEAVSAGRRWVKSPGDSHPGLASAPITRLPYARRDGDRRLASAMNGRRNRRRFSYATWLAQGHKARRFLRGFSAWRI